MKKLVLALLLAALGVGIGSYEAPNATAQDKGAGKKMTDTLAIDPDPKKCVKTVPVATKKLWADFGALSRGKDFSCPSDKECRVPIKMHDEDPDDKKRCYGQMDFDRIVVDGKGRDAPKRIVWYLESAPGQSRKIDDYEFESGKGVVFNNNNGNSNDESKDFDDGKRHDHTKKKQEFSYRNKHKRENAICFDVYVIRNEADKPPTKCSIKDPLIWNQ
jgi:hypothetical protein